MLARFVGGVAKGNISLSTAVMADLLPERHRGKGMVSRAYCVHVYGSGGNIGVGVWWVELFVYMCIGLVVTLG